MNNKIPVVIFPMKEKHLDSLLKVEHTSCENYWTTNMFLKCIHRKNGYGGLAAFDNMELIGSLGYEISCGELQIWNIVVHSNFRRRGIGEQLIAKVQKLVPSNYSTIKFNVRESNTIAHLFLRHCTFSCRTIAKNYFKDKIKKVVTRENAYCFEYGPKVVKPKKINVTNAFKEITIRPK